MSRYTRPKTPRGTKNPNVIVVREHEGRRVPSINGLKNQGDFCVMPRLEHPEIKDVFEIAFILPRHRRPASIIVKRVPSVVNTPQCADHVWNWDGNEEAPTVNPRIDYTEDGKRFFGWLIGGKFVAS